MALARSHLWVPICMSPSPVLNETLANVCLEPQLSVCPFLSLALSKKRRLDSECRSVIKVGRGWGQGWGCLRGRDSKAIPQRREGGLPQQGLDPGNRPCASFPQRRPEIPPLKPLTFGCERALTYLRCQGG